MTQLEFKNQIKTLLDQYAEYAESKNRIQFERELADSFKEHDSKLANLLNKHVNIVEEIYNYIFSRADL